MGFDTIIGNGSVVTATDTYVADVAISDGKIAFVHQSADSWGATSCGQLLMMPTPGAEFRLQHRHDRQRLVATRHPH